MKQANLVGSSSDQLFLQIFGDDTPEGYLPSVLASQEASNPFSTKPGEIPTPHHTPHKPAPKTFATFSQLMTLAHNFNRKHHHRGAHPVSGCHCYNCNKSRLAA